MNNVLEIRLQNPIHIDDINAIEKAIKASPYTQFLVVDTGDHDFASIAVMKHFRATMLALTPQLEQFKKIAIIHPAQYQNISDNPDKYDYFTSKDAAAKWFQYSSSSI